ncbi:MAG: L,D-transpeptidase family protein [Verrucomicrobiota bacterium]|nr:L,D-transpeptidase family protein [Verrucomicrobiota bacterium]
MKKNKYLPVAGAIFALIFLVQTTGIYAQSTKQRTVQGPVTYTDIKTKERQLEEAKKAGKTKMVKVYKPAHQPTWTWTPEVLTAGPVKVEIFIAEQRMFVWRGGEIIAETEVSTGKQGHDTPAGYYKIVNKKVDHKSNLYGCVVNSETGAVVNHDATPSSAVPSGCYYRPASMPHFQRLTFTGIGFHAGYLPGRADSHGCVRLPDVMAANIYSVTGIGTPVTIYPYMGAVMPKTAKNDFTKQSISKEKVTTIASSTVNKTTAPTTPAPIANMPQAAAPAPQTSVVKAPVESFIPAKTP